MVYRSSAGEDCDTAGARHEDNEWGVELVDETDAVTEALPPPPLPPSSAEVTLALPSGLQFMYVDDMPDKINNHSTGAPPPPSTAHETASAGRAEEESGGASLEELMNQLKAATSSR